MTPLAAPKMAPSARSHDTTPDGTPPSPSPNTVDMATWRRSRTRVQAGSSPFGVDQSKQLLRPPDTLPGKPALASPHPKRPSPRPQGPDDKHVVGIGTDEADGTDAADRAYPSIKLNDMPLGEDGDVIARIEACVAYMRSLKPGQHAYADAAFTLATFPETTGLLLLRQAAADGIATLLFDTPTQHGGAECYAIGQGPLAIALPFPLPVDPQWWKGMSRAEIKAGPLAGSEDIKCAQKALKQQDTRKRRNPKPRNADRDNLNEALYRQKMGLSMDGARRYPTTTTTPSNREEDVDRLAVEDVMDIAEENPVDHHVDGSSEQAILMEDSLVNDNAGMVEREQSTRVQRTTPSEDPALSPQPFRTRSVGPTGLIVEEQPKGQAESKANPPHITPPRASNKIDMQPASSKPSQVLASRACTNCRKVRKRCNRGRPCSLCVTTGKEVSFPRIKKKINNPYS